MSVKMYLQIFKVYFIFFCFIIVDSEKACGIARNHDNDKIVGGQAIGYNKYPWYSMLLLANSPSRVVCGGSLISSNCVMTAAHCYKSFFNAVKKGEITLEELYLVQLGVENRCVSESSVQTFATIEVHIHKEYLKSLRYGDIAILKLDYKADDFTPVCLPTVRYESNNRTNLPAIVVGVGKESSSAWRLPCHVKEASVIIQPDTTCIRMIDHENGKGSEFHDAFCAGTTSGGTDTCQGDSGGPLQILMEDNRYVELGITSFGYGCGQRNYYGVYTDVSHYLDWIHGIVGQTNTTNAKAQTNFNAISNSSKIAKSSKEPQPTAKQSNKKHSHFAQFLKQFME